VVNEKSLKSESKIHCTDGFDNYHTNDRDGISDSLFAAAEAIVRPILNGLDVLPVDVIRCEGDTEGSGISASASDVGKVSKYK
jgi:hypothetical protein